MYCLEIQACVNVKETAEKYKNWFPMKGNRWANIVFYLLCRISFFKTMCIYFIDKILNH